MLCPQAGRRDDFGTSKYGKTGKTRPWRRHDGDFIDIASGAFIMGTNEDYRYPGDGEGPAREIILDGFRIAKHSVSNQQFAVFVDDTGYQTEAERFEWSFVFHLLLPDDFPDTRGVEQHLGGGRCTARIGHIPPARSQTSMGC